MHTSKRFRSLLLAILLAAAASLTQAEENVWVSHGPNDGGWINDLAIADSVAYAATINGVFLSHDRGATWQLSGLEGQSILQIDARRGADIVLAVGDNYSLYASRDRGESWAPLSGPPSALAVGIDPNQLSTIYVGTYDTIWKSTDAGASWQTLPTPGDPPGPHAFAFNSGAIYLLSSRRLYKSADGGFSWIWAQPPLEFADALSTGSVNGVIYAFGWIAATASLCRSADSAATWTCSASQGFLRRIFEIPGETPANPRLVASSSFNEEVFLSDDGGATWTHAGGGLRGPLTAFASDTAEALVLAGTDAQVFRTEDRGDTWTPFRAGLKAIKIGALAVDPRRPSTIWAGGIGQYPLSGPGLFRSTDYGVSWSPEGGLQGPPGVRALSIDPENSRTIYAGDDRVFRTDDGGETWTSSLIPESVGSLTLLAIDPSDSGQVWAATGPGSLQRSGGGWREIGSGLFRSDGAERWDRRIAQYVSSVLFDQRRPGTIYAGSYDEIRLDPLFNRPTRKGGSIFVSHDYGATFRKNVFDFGIARSIVADPFDEDDLYLATAIGVFRSLDRGASWEALGSPFAEFGFGVLNGLVADPVRPGRLYVSGSPGNVGNGVARSDDGGRTWQSFSEGLPNVGAGPLVISPDGRWLYVGSPGAAGVYARDLGAPEPPEPCAASATRLCLAGNRYAVDLFAGRRGEPATIPGTARSLADRAGYFSLPFATGDAELPEVVVKVLGEGAFGLEGSPLFYSSLTTLPYTLLVTDTLTGEQRTYRNDSARPFCGAVNVAFTPDVSPAPGPKPAVAAEDALALLSNRFSVTLEARHSRTGAVSAGRAIASSDRYGFFTLPGFTSDPTLPEVIVKMLDKTAVSGNFWLFYTGLTSLDYTLTVTDTVTGAVRTFESPGDYCGNAATLSPDP